MGFRCELCDEFLNLFQFSHLCDSCYRIRTIIKCYNTNTIVSCLENNFLLTEKQVEDFKKNDKEFMDEEEKRLENEFKQQLEGLCPTDTTDAVVEDTEITKDTESDISDLHTKMKVEREYQDKQNTRELRKTKK